MGDAVTTFRGSQRARQILEKLVDYPNVPRKKPKFFNFMMNSFRSYGVNESQLNEIWSVIEVFDKKTANPNNNNGGDIESQNLKRKLDNSQNNIEVPAKQQKVDSTRITEETIAECDENSFDWTHIIKEECCKHPNNEIDYKKLEKKVRNVYFLKAENEKSVTTFSKYFLRNSLNVGMLWVTRKKLRQLQISEFLALILSVKRPVMNIQTAFFSLSLSFPKLL